MAKIEIRIGLAQNDKGVYYVTFGDNGLSPQESAMLGDHLKHLGDKAEVLNMLLAEKVPLDVVRKIESNT